MNWTPVLIVLAVVILFLLLKRAGQVSAKAAAEHLQHGAMIIDVRSPGEFSGGHLPQAINIPLDQVETQVPRRVKDKNQVLLLHCQSGTRSGIARRKLRALGYAHAYNLGSYGRAARIAGDRS